MNIDFYIQPLQHKIPALYDLIFSLLRIPLSFLSLYATFALFIYDLFNYVITVLKGPIKKEVLFSNNSNSDEFHVVITGASSGIGESLAKIYADRNVRLTLLSRSTEKLKILADSLSTGCIVEYYSVDVSDVVNLEKKLVEIDNRFPISLIIVNAGISHSTIRDSMTEVVNFVDFIKPIVQVNYVGAISSIQPLLKRFISRRSGQIAVVSSLAGLIGFPSSPTYSSTKGGIATLVRLLRPTLAKYNVKMNLICPGYVQTPMIAKVKTKNTVVPVDVAAEWIKDGLERDLDLIAFPFSSYIQGMMFSVLPQRISLYLLSKYFKGAGEVYY